MNATFSERRRQPYIDEISFINTLAHNRSEAEFGEQERLRYRETERDRSVMLGALATSKWGDFQLRYTAGEAPSRLAVLLTEVVEVYEREAEAQDLLSDEDYSVVFSLVDLIDEYVDYIGIISVCVLLHRKDLIPRVHALMKGTDYDGSDLLIEELFNFYLPDRPVVDEWFWDKPYGMLVEVIDGESSVARAKAMKNYVTKWYSSMKGLAHFWGKHEKVTPEYSEYVGYWAFCAAAFTYLYDIDDTAYRDEIVYPKDLVDYARSMPRQLVRLNDGTEFLRVAGGQRCPRAGNWFSPAKENSARHFDEGEQMPSFDASEYGQTIWQWNSGTSV